MRVMKIGLDARPLQDGYKTHAHRGIGAFTRSLYEAIARAAGKGDSFALIVDPDYPAIDTAIESSLTPGPGTGRSRRARFETITLPASSGASALSAHVPWEHGRRFRSLPCDAIYFPHFEDAPRQAGGPERFVTVHDCIPFREDGPYKRAAILRSVRTLMARRILRAAHVAAISRATRNDLARLFAIEPDEVALLMPAPHPQFVPGGRRSAGSRGAANARPAPAIPARDRGRRPAQTKPRARSHVAARAGRRGSHEQEHHGRNDP